MSCKFLRDTFHSIAIFNENFPIARFSRKLPPRIPYSHCQNISRESECIDILID